MLSFSIPHPLEQLVQHPVRIQRNQAWKYWYTQKYIEVHMSVWAY